MAQQQRVYVVMGQTGEYSDHIEWTVGAYTNEGAAQTHVERCAGWYRRHKSEVGRRSQSPPTNPYDPDMQTDYTGTNYYYYDVPLFDASLPIPECSRAKEGT